MTYMESGDPDRRLTDYYPAWLDNLANNVTLEGSATGGFVQGAEAVRTVLVQIRALYDYQKFNFVGPYGDNGWLEDYTAGVCSEPMGNITLVTRNAGRQAQHIVGNYRPLSSPEDPGPFRRASSISTTNPSQTEPRRSACLS